MKWLEFNLFYSILLYSRLRNIIFNESFTRYFRSNLENLRGGEKLSVFLLTKWPQVSTGCICGLKLFVGIFPGSNL